MTTQTLTIQFQSLPNAELTAADRDLCDAAAAAALRAYAPYSHFFVGAAVRLSNGRLVDGNNQENAAYPSGTCAERTTLYYANAAFPDAAVETLAIAAWHDGGAVPFISPCGACRQVIMETETRQGRPIRILLHGRDTTYVLDSAHALMPLWTPPKSDKALER